MDTGHAIERLAPPFAGATIYAYCHDVNPKYPATIGLYLCKVELGRPFDRRPIINRPQAKPKMLDLQTPA